jgi:hypothetical protein
MMLSRLLSGLAVGVIEGALLYVIDARVGVRVYRWWYDLTHRDPMAPDVERGFILNRKANARFSVATVVALVQNWIALEMGWLDPFLAMLTVAIEVPVLMGGFYLGPGLRNLWRRKDPLLAVVDQIESGETSIGAEMKRVTGKVTGALRRDDRPATPSLEAPTPPPVPDVPPPAPEPEPDPVEAMRRFTKRQQ